MNISLVAYTQVAYEGGFEFSGFPALTVWVEHAETALSLSK